MKTSNANTDAPAARQALWVGGPPGKTFQRITAKLAADGIVVAAKQEERFSNIPAGVDVVIVCIDMTDHATFDGAKAAAKAAGLPFVAARLDYSRTRPALVSAGLVPEVAPVEVQVAALTEALEDKAAPQDPAEALRALLRALPLDLARLAQQEATQAVLDAERAERAVFVTAAVEAFRALPSEQAVIEFVEALTENERAGLSVLLR